MQNIQHLKSFYPQATILKRIPIVKFQHEERIHLRNSAELKEKLIGMKRKQMINKLDIVSDYDQTISSFQDDYKRNVNASFGIFRESRYVSADLSEKANNLFHKYHKYEVSKEYTLEFKQRMMDEWLHESMNLILHNNINSTWLQNIINDNVFAFRHGFDSFLKYSHANNLNFFVISGGIQDVIYYTMNQIIPLQEYTDLELIANKIYFDENGKVIGSHNQVVHSHNKAQLLNREQYPQLNSSCILMGDMPHDSFMTQFAGYQNQIKIGFVKNEQDIDHYKRRFDIVIHNQGSYVGVEYLLRKVLDPQTPIPETLDNQVSIIGKELIQVIRDSEIEEKHFQVAFS